MDFRGYNVEVVGWNTDHTEFIVKTDDKTIVITDNGHEGWKSYDTRHMRLKNVFYDGIGFDVKDGVAYSNGIEHSADVTDNPYKEIYNDNNINDKIKVIYPTLNDIFTDVKLFDIAFSYYYNWNDNDSVLANGGKIALTWLFEGFFFYDGTYTKYYVKHGIEGFKQIA